MSTLYGGTWTNSRWVTHEHLNIRGGYYLGIIEDPRGVFRVSCISAPSMLRAGDPVATGVYRGKPTCDLLRAEKEMDDIRNAVLLDALPASPLDEDIYAILARAALPQKW